LARSPLLIALVPVVLLALPHGAKAQALVPYTIVENGIPASLTGSPGDAARGRALVQDRASTCLLCHAGPFPESGFQSESQLRLRLVDASHFNPATIMPSFYRVDGLNRVGQNFRGKTILSATGIEDIVAYLATLRE